MRGLVRFFASLDKEFVTFGRSATPKAVNATAALLMNEGQDFETLVLRAQGGDRASLEALLLKAHPDLRRFAGRVCNTGEDAEDAIQHALMTVSTKLGTLRAAGRFTAWVFTVIRNECSRHVRLAARLAGRPIADAPHEAALEVHASQDRALERARLAEKLASCIAALPMAQREVFMMRELEGLSAAETAAKLGISVANVKVRLHRARAGMRETLRPFVEH